MQLQSLFNYFKSHPESSWLMEPQNCQKLYEFVMKHPIKNVLDLGTGIGLSASVVALALKDKGEKDFRIDSLEQFDKCVSLANDVIPQPLRTNINIFKSKSTLWKDDKVPYQYFSVYEYEGNKLLHDENSKLAYDLIVNDGPSFWAESDKLLDFPNGTINKMLKEGKLKAGTFIVFDGRVESLRLLERYYADNFWMYQLADKGGDFNVLEAKDGEAKFKDFRLEFIKTSTFFKEYAKNTISRTEQGPPSPPTTPFKGA